MSVGNDDIGTGVGITAAGAGAGAASGLSLPIVVGVMLVLAAGFYLFMKHRAYVERRIYAQNQNNKPPIHRPRQ